jgi:integrase
MTQGSLIGARHKTEAKKIHVAHNEWLTAHGIEGTHKTYLFRHARGQQLREIGGVELASAALGHTTTAMVERKYTEARKAMPLVAPGRRKAG